MWCACAQCRHAGATCPRVTAWTPGSEGTCCGQRRHAGRPGAPGGGRRWARCARGQHIPWPDALPCAPSVAWSWQAGVWRGAHAGPAAHGAGMQALRRTCSQLSWGPASQSSRAGWPRQGRGALGACALPRALSKAAAAGWRATGRPRWTCCTSPAPSWRTTTRAPTSARAWSASTSAPTHLTRAQVPPLGCASPRGSGARPCVAACQPAAACMAHRLAGLHHGCGWLQGTRRQQAPRPSLGPQTCAAAAAAAGAFCAAQACLPPPGRAPGTGTPVPLQLRQPLSPLQPCPCRRVALRRPRAAAAAHAAAGCAVLAGQIALAGDEAYRRTNTQAASARVGHCWEGHTRDGSLVCLRIIRCACRAAPTRPSHRHRTRRTACCRLDVGPASCLPRRQGPGVVALMIQGSRGGRVRAGRRQPHAGAAAGRPAAAAAAGTASPAAAPAATSPLLWRRSPTR